MDFALTYRPIVLATPFGIGAMNARNRDNEFHEWKAGSYSRAFGDARRP
jgi:hypothetical protein